MTEALARFGVEHEKGDDNRGRLLKFKGEIFASAHAAQACVLVDLLSALTSRAEAAEAKLAEYEAADQEAVAAVLRRASTFIGEG